MIGECMYMNKHMNVWSGFKIQPNLFLLITLLLQTVFLHAFYFKWLRPAVSESKSINIFTLPLM